MLLEVVLPLSLAFIMFSLGYGLTVSDFTRVMKFPKAFAMGAVAQIVLLPVVAFALLHLFSLPTELAVGVMILAFCPGGVTSNIFTKLAGGAVATEAVPGLDRTPTNNLLISNMPGPRGKLYLAGAPLIGFYGLPIVPPGSGLNITFLSCGDAICLAVGANPDAVDSPFTLTGYISDALDDLAREIEGGNKPKRKRKKAPARRSRSNK